MPQTLGRTTLHNTDTHSESTKMLVTAAAESDAACLERGGRLAPLQGQNRAGFSPDNGPSLRTEVGKRYLLLSRVNSRFARHIRGGIDGLNYYLIAD